MNIHEPELIGMLEPKLGRINWIDHNPHINSLFVAESFFDSPSIIEQFDSFNYNLKKEIPVQNHRINSGNYETDVHFLFSNEEGTLLYIIKNVMRKYKFSHVWSLEILSVD